MLRTALFEKLVTCTDPLEWASVAEELIHRYAYGIDELSIKAQMPRTVVLDRLEVLKSHREAVRVAEQHGKVLGRAEKVQDDNERRASGLRGVAAKLAFTPRQDAVFKEKYGRCGEDEQHHINRIVENLLVPPERAKEALRKISEQYPELVRKREKVKKMLDDMKLTHTAECVVPCTGCGVFIDLNMTEGTTVCLKCSKKSPKERGKVLCLEGGCKKWITKRVSEHFCKLHSTVLAKLGTTEPPRRSFEDYPERDRDGDPIWVGAGFIVTKVKDMTDGHLTAVVKLYLTRDDLSPIREKHVRAEYVKRGLDQKLGIKVIVERDIGLQLAEAQAEIKALKAEAKTQGGVTAAMVMVAIVSAISGYSYTWASQAHLWDALKAHIK